MGLKCYPKKSDTLCHRPLLSWFAFFFPYFFWISESKFDHHLYPFSRFEPWFSCVFWALGLRLLRARFWSSAGWWGSATREELFCERSRTNNIVPTTHWDPSSAGHQCTHNHSVRYKIMYIHSILVHGVWNFDLIQSFAGLLGCWTADDSQGEVSNNFV